MEAKLVVVGDSGAGKQSLMKRQNERRFSTLWEPCLYDGNRQTVVIKGEALRLEIVPLGYPETFEAIILNYFRVTDGFMLVFSIADRATFSSLQSYYDTVRLHQPNAPVVLVGTKSDLEEKRQVSTSEAEALALLWGVSYFETSALKPENVDEAFGALFRLVWELKRNLTKRPLWRRLAAWSRTRGKS